jgi:hypothetical protein
MYSLCFNKHRIFLSADYVKQNGERVVKKQTNEQWYVTYDLVWLVCSDSVTISAVSPIPMCWSEAVFCNCRCGVNAVAS